MDSFPRTASTWLIVTAVVLVDQAGKAYYQDAVASSFVEPVTNPGLALGLLQPSRLVGLSLASIALIAIGWWMFARSLRIGLPLWPVGLAVGGSLGNLIDKVLLAEVRDFLLVGPIVVNLADLGLALGVAAFLTQLWQPGRSARHLPAGLSPRS